MARLLRPERYDHRRGYLPGLSTLAPGQDALGDDTRRADHMLPAFNLSRSTPGLKSLSSQKQTLASLTVPKPSMMRDSPTI